MRLLLYALKRVLLVIVYSLPQEILLLHRLCCSYKIFQQTVRMVKIPTARLMMHWITI